MGLKERFDIQLQIQQQLEASQSILGTLYNEMSKSALDSLQRSNS